jgi:hypothetical protein
MSKNYANEHPRNKKKNQDSNVKVAVRSESSELKDMLRDEYNAYKKDMSMRNKKPLSFRKIKKILLEQVFPSD